MALERNYSFSRDRITDIGLADVLSSMHLLSPGSARTKRAIAELLGFVWEPEEQPVPEPDLVPGQIDVKKKTAPDKGRAESGNEDLSSEPQNIEFLSPKYERDSDEGSYEDFLQGDALAETDVRIHFEKPPYFALFEERWFCSIASLMLADPTSTPELDMGQLEKKLYSLAPIERLPYKRKNTLNRGVQVLLDTSESMQPFLRDEFEIIASLYKLLGEYRVKVFEFEFQTIPEDHIIWRHDGPEKIQTEVPILIVSSFTGTNRQKLGQVKNYAPLVGLLDTARSKRCTVSALIPAREEFFPADLSNFIPFAYTWDRDTSPQKISKTRRKN